MKKLKFKNMEGKTGRPKKKHMEEPGLCSIFPAYSTSWVVP